MDWFLTVLGVGLVAVVVRDVFHTLFHPIGHGSLAPVVMKGVWRLLRLLPSHRPLASLTGPLGVCSVIATWGVIAVVGWTLIYLAQMPGAVSYSSDLDPSARHEIADSLYLSMVTVATVGFGDIVPTSAWLRFAAPLEALFGFMLVTAAVSWVLQIYPALHRRRVLALQLSTLRLARETDASFTIDSIPIDVLTTIAASVVEARNDFTQYGATYYFRDLEADASLAASLDYATQLATEAEASADAQVRLAGAMITAAVDSLAELLNDEFLHLEADTAAIVQAYAADHGHQA